MNKKINCKVLWERANKSTEDEDMEDDFHSDYLDMEQQDYMSISSFTQTPFGIMNNDHVNFKFWYCYTNFRLGDGVLTCTKEIEDIIADTDGIEYVEVLTPYRFKIAIGKLFEDSDIEIRKTIANKLSRYIETSYASKKTT